MRIYGLIILLMLTFTTTTNAGIDDVYTAIIDIEEVPIEQPENSIVFQFNISYEILNRGKAFAYSYATPPGIYLEWTVNFTDIKNKSFSNNMFNDKTVHIDFLEKTIVRGYQTMTFILNNVTKTTMDGKIGIKLHAGQRDENSYHANIIFEQGEMRYEYESTPLYWALYPRMDREDAMISNEDKTYSITMGNLWFTILLILVFRIGKLKR